MLRKIIVWGIVVVVVLLAGAYFTRNYIVEQAVEEGSTRSLGLSTDLGSAGLSLGAGSLDLNAYRISNPDGFEADHIFAIEHSMVGLQEGSVFDDVIIVDSLIIEGVRVNIEQKDTRGNYSTLMDNIRSMAAGPSESGQTQLRIQRVALRDIQVSLAIMALGETRYEKNLTLDNFTIDGVGTDGGATIGQVATRVVREVMQRAISEGQSQYPDIFSGKVEEAIDKAKETIESEVSDKLKDIGKSITGGE